MKTPSLRVVLVDDDPDDRYLIHWALITYIKHVVVEELTTGQALLDWLEQQRNQTDSLDDSFVTIILLDMHMPQLTGLETLQSLGDMSPFPYMPVVMLTTSIDEQLKHQVYQQGIHLYLVKPTGQYGFYRVAEAVKLCYRDTVHMREQLELPLKPSRSES